MTKTSVIRIITVSGGSNCALSFWWGLYNEMNCSFKNNFSYCIASSNSIWLPSLNQSFVTGPLLHVKLLRAEWEFFRRGVWKSLISAGGVWERNWARTGSALNGQLLEESEALVTLGSRVGTPLICPATLVSLKRDTFRPLSGKLGHAGKRIEFPHQITASLPPQSVHPAIVSGIQSCNTFKRLFGTDRPLFVFEKSEYFLCILSSVGLDIHACVDLIRTVPPCYLVWNIWGLYSTLQEERKILWKTAF